MEWRANAQANACAVVPYINQMIPKRVFSPSLTVKPLTSENRLKGNPQLDCDASGTSNTGAIKKHQQLAATRPIKTVEFAEPIATSDDNAPGHRYSIDKINNHDNVTPHPTSQPIYRRTSHGQNECSTGSGSSASKLNNAQIERIIDNLIGTTEAVLVEGNGQRYEFSSAGSQQCARSAHESPEKSGLSVKRFVAETTINNVPLRDVIQRKVSKLSNQLLHSNRDNTANNGQPKQLSKAKRSLFRRKTTAITKEQIEAAKNLNKTTPKTSNNKPITDETLHFDKQANDNSRHGNDTNHIVLGEAEKQKQTNNVTIATASPFVDRKDANASHKNRLNEVQQRNVRGVGAKTSQFNGIDANDVDNNRTDSTKFVGCLAQKQCFAKQSPAASKLKSENSGSHQYSIPADAVRAAHDNLSSTSSKALPPPYIDPPTPYNGQRAQQPFVSKHPSPFTSKSQKTNKNNNKLEHNIKNSRQFVDGIDDEHGNYAIPYGSIEDVCSSPTAVEPIRIANQPQPSKAGLGKSTASTARKPTYTKKSNRQHNRSVFVLQQKAAIVHGKDNKDSTNDKSHIVCVYGRDNVNELILFDTIDQSTSTSSESSNSSSGNSSNSRNSSSSSSSRNNEPNISTNPLNDKNIDDIDTMDPMAITNLTSPCDMLTKPEFSSSHLQNIPVRPRKGIPHLENYCLFDPSKDFLNEKELKKKFGLVSGDCMPFPITILDKRTTDDELIKEFAYEDQEFVYDTLEDVKEEDEEMTTTADGDTSYPNYFTIDPDYIEQNKMETLFGNANHLQPIVESETEDIYSDSNANLNKFNVYENHPITGRSQVVPLKKSPQIEKIVRQASQPIITTFAAKKAALKATTKMEPLSSSSAAVTKNRDTKSVLKHRTKINPPTDLPLRSSCQPKMPTKKRNSLTMKHSVSTPQLSLKDLLADYAALPMVEIDWRNLAPSSVVPSSTNRLSQYKVRRPTSQHSDADSGFLSPVTPPDAFNQATQHVAFPQCDLIEVSRILYVIFAAPQMKPRRFKCNLRVLESSVDAEYNVNIIYGFI